MWYWDHFPASGKYAKKPLTKDQIKKLQESYQKAWEIAEHVQKLEVEEKEKTREIHEQKLDEIFL